ncbi:MAG: D-alanine--D-alanine ligase [Endomicrobia bacterium]|nr:D-alanine--D-alanine ligase [Endomicrobiia bacterium]MCX7941029.1 D-alanine--D-alanine ligase [Endomicrobiia bacterium]MDW8055399.1 D-alanine--D-alanine ligase [Elusimicrobiota bacterium]
MRKIKIAVLYGGFSSERNISLKTGRAVFENLKKWKDFDVKLVDLKKEYCLEQVLSLKKQRIDLVFIALHGKFGEDGKLQTLLDTLGIKYTGADSTSSMIAMNKHLTKILLKGNGIPTPEWENINSIEEIEHIKLKPPIVVKPSDEGSTIGVSVVRNKNELAFAVRKALRYSTTVIIEKFINGKEITVPILDSEILPMIEIVPRLSEYYDFKSKYSKGGSQHIIPPQVDRKMISKIADIARKAARVIGCEILCRIDLILDKDRNTPYVLEVNTIPGMTPTSLLPEAASYCGITFPELVRKIVFSSLKKYE